MVTVQAIAKITFILMPAVVITQAFHLLSIQSNPQAVIRPRYPWFAYV